MGLRGQTLGIWAALLAVGLLAASPFLSRGMVGTGEAYNYSLGVADGVVQMRAGHLPPLVGQTEYAFNGRIHPLRNAPYLFYLAAAIDAVTLHRLTFWELQNASLALSLVAAVLCCYAGLRWATDCGPALAGCLAALYGLSPPLLCAAHQLDLFMTVHAAVFVPLAVAAAVQGCRRPSFSADAAWAAALAAAWLAHPPVAVWLTFATGAVRLLHFAARPRWGTLARGAAAVPLFLALASFVFVSVATLNHDLGYFQGGGDLFRNFADVIMRGIRSTFPAALLPVTRTASASGDFQLGYVGWILTLAALAAGARRWRRDHDPVPALVSGLACFLLLLLLPVPGLTPALWRLVPGSVLTLTTEWPMQRLYLVALGLGVFGAATALPPWFRAHRPPRGVLPLLAAAGAAWVLYQAVPFLFLGKANRWTLDTTEQAYQPSNLNLTVTSYAFLGLPPTFNHGVMDPALEFRILQDGRDEVASNLAAAFAASPVVAQGPILLSKATPRSAASRPIVLQPGHRYLLTFAFKIPPAPGLVTVLGSAIHRFYGLPESGERQGFGMLPGQRRTIPLWTDAAKPETVVIGVAVTDPAVKLDGVADLADFSLQDIDLPALPVRLEGFLPLRFTVDQPRDACTVETPRRYLRGYRARVNGVEVIPLASPTRQVMVPIPPGKCVVELWYEGPVLARWAFWACAAAWGAFIAWRIAGSPLPTERLRQAGQRAGRAATYLWAHRRAAAALAAGLGVLAFLGVRTLRQRAYLQAVGPLKIDFRLPYEMVGVNQPLLSTGRPGAGTIIFVAILDSRHVRIGADVWGRLYQSKAVPINFFDVQSLVVSDSGLFPLDHPALAGLAPVEMQALRGRLRIELNGQPVIDEACSAYESTPGEVHVGHTDMGSLTKPDFLGEIVGSRRLPIPRIMTLPAQDRLAMDVRFPALPVGASQPLLSLTCGSNAVTCFVTQLENQMLRISTRTATGTLAASAPVADPSGSVRHLVFQPEGTGERNALFGLACYLDGREVVGDPKPVKRGAPSSVTTGLDLNGTPGVASRFTGLISRVSLVAGDPSAGADDPLGPEHFIIRLPTGRPGRNEPLLTTGHTGMGDLLYVMYVDPDHIRLGFDHWGTPGTVTAPIKVDYGQPHEFTVRTGALYPDVADDAAWHGVPRAERAARAAAVEVTLDGEKVLDAHLTAYPSTLAMTTLLHNRIGMSTADQDFTGSLEFSERTGVAHPDEGSRP